MQLIAEGLEWCPEYSLGDSHADEEHQQLFAVVSDYVRAVNQGMGHQMSRWLLKFFMEKSQDHFANEERLMQDTGYPFVVEHQSAHLSFMMMINDLARLAESRDVSRELALYLLGWAKTHTCGLDADFARHVREQA